MKTQTRIAILFFLIILTLITLLSGAVYYFALRYSLNDFYKQLEARAFVEAKAVLEGGETDMSVLDDVRDFYLDELSNESEHFYQISPGKDFTEEAEDLEVPVEFFSEILQGKKAFHKDGNRFHCGILYPVDGIDYVVVVSANNYYNSHHLADLRNIFLIVVLIASLLAFSLAVIFSKYIFKPVKNITNKVKEISSENLHLRLENVNSQDEVSELTDTFNDMLNRLQTAFETQNNFISNASHELSTPLTSIIGEADVALKKERNPKEYIDSIQVMLREAEKLEKITKSLLFLAQTGFDGKRVKFSKTRLDELLTDVISTTTKMNAKSKISIDYTLMPDDPKKLKVNANKQLLHLAFSNIISNACKYSDNQEVLVSIGATDTKVYVVVKDQGIGIPKKDLSHIYDPFFRAGNTGTYEGYGIGLPLARNIILMHKGTIKVNSEENQGVTVQVTFPIWQEST